LRAGGRCKRAAQLLGFADVANAVAGRRRGQWTDARNEGALNICVTRLGRETTTALRERRHGLDWHAALELALSAVPQPAVPQHLGDQNRAVSGQGSVDPEAQAIGP
jgi:hypothetical protein